MGTASKSPKRWPCGFDAWMIGGRKGEQIVFANAELTGLRPSPETQVNHVNKGTSVLTSSTLFGKDIEMASRKLRRKVVESWSECEDRDGKHELRNCTVRLIGLTQGKMKLRFSWLLA